MLAAFLAAYLMSVWGNSAAGHTVSLHTLCIFIC